MQILLRHSLHKFLAGLEVGQIVCRNYQRSILGNITSSLLCTVLQTKCAETTKIYILLLNQRILDNFHRSNYNILYGGLICTSLLCNGTNQFCFCHSLM